MSTLRFLLPGCAALVAESVAGAQSARESALRGVVLDSIEMRPLAGAVVQLVALPVKSAPLLATSDSAGAFSFDTLAPGSYLLGFSHARLDSLGLETGQVRLELRLAATVVAALGVPSAASMVRAACKTDIAKDSTGILRGFARSARDGFPVPRARVRVEWPEFVLGRQGMREVTRSIDAQANESGRFVICEVPLGTTVLTRVYAGADSSGVLELGMPETGLLRRDLVLGDASHAVDMLERDVGAGAIAAPTRTDGVTPEAARTGTARIRGIIVRSDDGTPVEGATLRLFGSVGEATTRGDGTFLLTEVASGTQMLEVRAIGFAPGRLAVDVMGSGDTAAEIVLRSASPSLTEGTTLLDTLRVRTDADRLALSAMSVRRAFETRRQSGVGVFLTDSIIRSRNVQLPSELFRGVSGITVTSCSGGQGVYMRASASFNASKGLCLPTVFLDAARAPRALVDQMAIMADLRAIEVYPRGQLAPPQFQSSDGCGVIVLWTRTMWEARNLPARRS